MHTWLNGYTLALCNLLEMVVQKVVILAAHISQVPKKKPNTHKKLLSIYGQYFLFADYYNQCFCTNYARCKLYDVQGKMYPIYAVKQQDSLYKIDVRSLIPQLYRLQIQTEQGVFFKNFIKSF